MGDTWQHLALLAKPVPKLDKVSFISMGSKFA